MFDAITFLHMRRKGNFPKCWLAATLSENMFRKQVRKNQISRVNVVNTCNEIISMLNGEYKDVEPHCRLVISSQLTFGALRIHTFQVEELADSLFKLTLQMIPKRDKKKRTITAIPDRLMDGAVPFPSIPSLPSLTSEPPFPSDEHLLVELSPGTLGRRADDSHELSLPILTENQVNEWNEGEDAIWEGTDAADQPQESVIDSAALPVGDDDLPVPMVKPLPKRTSKSTNSDTPAKKKRRSVRTNGEATVDERINEDDPSILRKGQLDEPQPFPIDPPIPTNIVDSVAPIDIIEPAAPIDVIEPAAPIDIFNPVALMESPIPAVPQVQPIPQIDQPADSTAVRPSAAEIIEPTIKQRPRRGKKIDKNKQISTAHQKRRQQSITLAHTVTHSGIQANPAQMPPPQYYPSTIFLFGMENINSGRLRKYANEILDDFRIAIVTHFLEGTDFSARLAETNQPREPAHLPIQDISIMNADTVHSVCALCTDTVHSVRVTNTVHQVTEIAEPPVEIPQVEFTDNALPLEITDEPQLPLADIDDTFAVPLENTNDAITKGIGNLNVSNIAPESGDARRRKIVFDPDMKNVSSPARRNGKAKDRRSSHSKSSSSGERITDIQNIPASPRIDKSVEEAVVTKKDVEACLEILWHNSEVISFETLAPPGLTSPSEAAAYFMHIGDFYEEGKVELSQDGTNGPLYIEKIARSVPRD